MEQHPVPQQISSYEFRLVGDMTLKQFAQVAGGVLIAFLLYASPLPGFLKWPFIALFVFLGIAMAFLPFEERPLQTWVIAFLRAIYSPTQYLWQKQPQKPAIFEEKTVLSSQNLPPFVVPADQKKLTEYLATLSSGQSPLDQKEEFFLKQIQALFPSSLPTPTPVIPIQPPPPPAPTPVNQPQISPYAPHSVRPWQEEKTQTAKFYPQIPMPSIPEVPNILVGMVLDKGGKIVENVILEIRDSQGNPVRALRTNKLGQFRIATQLVNDTYEIEIEKEGMKFDLLKVELKGEIVQPIEVRAK